MTDIIVSHHTESDLTAIAAIEEVGINPPWSYRAICDFARYDTNRILVAKKGDTVMGYITYSNVLDEVQIANIATHPDFRRMGIGRLLLDNLFREAVNNKMSVITLEVRQSNESAASLYTKCGYAEVGRRRGYYKNPTEDAILMNLNL